MKKSGILIKCEVCSKEFYVQSYRIGKAKFCSLNCANSLRYKHANLICKQCGKKFVVSGSRIGRKFCSSDCYAEYNTKVKCARDIRRKQKRLVRLRRGCNSSRNARKIAFLEKEMICEICGYREYDFCLDVHHKDNDPNNNNISNLIILCCMCHKKLHKNVISI